MWHTIEICFFLSFVHFLLALSLIKIFKNLRFEPLHRVKIHGHESFLYIRSFCML